MFVYTKHTIEKMDGLGIEKSDIERAIKEGMKWKEEQTDKWHARHSNIEVVFVKSDTATVIVTTYFAGGEK